MELVFFKCATILFLFSVCKKKLLIPSFQREKIKSLFSFYLFIFLFFSKGKRQVKKIFKNAAKALEQKKPSQDEREKAPLPPTKSKPTKISLKESIGFLGSIDLPNPSLPNPAFPGFSSVMPREFQFSAKKGETTFSTYLLSIYLLRFAFFFCLLIKFNQFFKFYFYLNFFLFLTILDRVTGMNLNQIQMKVDLFFLSFFLKLIKLNQFISPNLK